METPLAEKTAATAETLAIAGTQQQEQQQQKQGCQQQQRPYNSWDPGKPTATITSATSESVATAEEAAIGPTATADLQATLSIRSHQKCSTYKKIKLRIKN
jgi:hypothetical protein